MLPNVSIGTSAGVWALGGGYGYIPDTAVTSLYWDNVPAGPFHFVTTPQCGRYDCGTSQTNAACATFHAATSVPSEPLTASFTFTPAAPTEIHIGTNVTFTSSVSGGHGAYTYHWAFDNHTTSALADPVHRFVTLGLITVWLNVTDAQGNHTSISRIVAVFGEAPSPPPPSPTGISFADLLFFIFVGFAIGLVVASSFGRRKY